MCGFTLLRWFICLCCRGDYAADLIFGLFYSQNAHGVVDLVAVNVPNRRDILLMEPRSANDDHDLVLAGAWNWFGAWFWLGSLSSTQTQQIVDLAKTREFADTAKDCVDATGMEWQWLRTLPVKLIALPVCRRFSFKLYVV